MTHALLDSSALAFLPVASAGDLTDFRSFQAEVRCPGCGEFLAFRVEPAHLQTRTACPHCSRALTGLIHRMVLERATLA